MWARWLIEWLNGWRVRVRRVLLSGFIARRIRIKNISDNRGTQQQNYPDEEAADRLHEIRRERVPFRNCCESCRHIENTKSVPSSVDQLPHPQHTAR